jgi:hypothetical protein
VWSRYENNQYEPCKILKPFILEKHLFFWSHIEAIGHAPQKDNIHTSIGLIEPPFGNCEGRLRQWVKRHLFVCHSLRWIETCPTHSFVNISNSHSNYGADSF